MGEEADRARRGGDADAQARTDPDLHPDVRSVVRAPGPGLGPGAGLRPCGGGRGRRAVTVLAGQGCRPRRGEDKGSGQDPRTPYALPSLHEEMFRRTDARQPCEHRDSPE
ncbi:hypothetical protein GCM10017744_015740 [Streptomyces antimycoticus]|uniref:Uncharacterized protein n=1 Tax=Streptomyces antimycoticus TaxID=68175 RepID=A0A4D4KMI1_9ACTN|nr:hypothetical protein SANT12839_085700 [Streptomyces antimycoticus]